jgi:hypothetical protein
MGYPTELSMQNPNQPPFNDGLLAWLTGCNVNIEASQQQQHQHQQLPLNQGAPGMASHDGVAAPLAVTVASFGHRGLLHGQHAAAEQRPFLASILGPVQSDGPAGTETSTAVRFGNPGSSANFTAENPRHRSSRGSSLNFFEQSGSQGQSQDQDQNPGFASRQEYHQMHRLGTGIYGQLQNQAFSVLNDGSSLSSRMSQHQEIEYRSLRLASVSSQIPMPGEASYSAVGMFGNTGITVSTLVEGQSLHGGVAIPSFAAADTVPSQIDHSNYNLVDATSTFRDTSLLGSCRASVADGTLQSTQQQESEPQQELQNRLEHTLNQHQQNQSLQQHFEQQRLQSQLQQRHELQQMAAEYSQQQHQQQAAVSMVSNTGQGSTCTLPLLPPETTWKGRGRSSTFPLKLHQMLLDLEKKQGASEIASFLPHGRGFQIYKPKEFSK